MAKFFNIIIFSILILTNNLNAKENIMLLKLKDGEVKIEMFPDVAPNHVNRITELENMTMLFFIELLMVLWLKQETLSLVILHLKILI